MSEGYEVYKRLVLKPGTEDFARSQHKLVVGNTITRIEPFPEAIYFRVLPISTRGVVPYGSKSVVWANVALANSSTYTYSVDVYNLPEDACSEGTHYKNLRSTLSFQPDLPSALQRARELVGANAPQQRGDLALALVVIPEIISVYASEESVVTYLRERGIIKE
jgi:hypothetical protein